MLRTRLWMGTLLIVLAVGALVVDQQFAPWYPVLFVLVLGLSLAACSELLHLLGATRRPNRREQRHREQCERSRDNSAKSAQSSHPGSPSRRLRGGKERRASGYRLVSKAGLCGTVDMKWHRKSQGPIE